MAAPTAFTGKTGVWNTIIEDTITLTRFMVLPILNVRGDISFRDM
jgi:hypothetical protein